MVASQGYEHGLPTHYSDEVKKCMLEITPDVDAAMFEIVAILYTRSNTFSNTGERTSKAAYRMAAIAIASFMADRKAMIEAGAL
jgi:hypothetical protein